MKIGYERASTAGQRTLAQTDRLLSAGCERIFSDSGESGSKASRPQWDACLFHLRRDDSLIVVRLDRIGRKLRDLIDIADTLRDRGVSLCVLDQAIDLATAAGRYSFHVQAATVELEWDRTRERTMDGLAAARARGRIGGGKPKLTPAQSEEVKAMFVARRKPREIMELFGISRATLYRIVGPEN